MSQNPHNNIPSEDELETCSENDDNYPSDSEDLEYLVRGNDNGLKYIFLLFARISILIKMLIQILKYSNLEFKNSNYNFKFFFSCKCLLFYII